MKIVEDATTLVINCEITEELIFRIVSVKPCQDTIEAFQNLVKNVPELMKECYEIRGKLYDKNADILCHDLRRMAQRLEAAMRYAKNHFNID